jgi:MFS family permease
MFVVWAAGTLGAAVAPDLAVAAVAMVVAGLGNGLTFPTTVVIIQQAAADEIRGRVFTVIISVHNALLGLSFAAAAGLQQMLGARWVFGGAASALLLGGMTAFALTRGGEARVEMQRQQAA